MGIDSKLMSGKVRELYGELFVSIIPPHLIPKDTTTNAMPDILKVIPEHWIDGRDGITGLKFGSIITSYGWLPDDNSINFIVFNQVRTDKYICNTYCVSVPLDNSIMVGNHFELTVQDALNKDSVIMFFNLKDDPIGWSESERQDTMFFALHHIADKIEEHHVTSITKLQVLTLDNNLCFTVMYGLDVLYSIFSACVIVSKKDPLKMKDSIQTFIM